jgi:hypothetical protein
VVKWTTLINSLEFLSTMSTNWVEVSMQLLVGANYGLVIPTFVV